MVPRQFFRLGLVLLLPVSIPATMVDAPEIDSLISQADYIVRVVVRSATPEWREHAGRRYIGTKVVLEIREVVKGAPPAPLVLDLIGGRIGQEEMVIEGMPVFHAGDQHVLFVHSEQKNMFPLVALMHGVYPIIREGRTGEEFVFRSNGQPLQKAEDVSLSMTEPRAGRPPATLARPLTAAAFLRQIRERATATQPSVREK